MPILNNYNTLSTRYQKTIAKPDKLFSTLPTVLRIAGDLKDKTILDLGCGAGFFTQELAAGGAKKVWGIDNSKKQISLANKNQAKNIEYILGDIFQDKLPAADIIVAPYVINYASNLKQLKSLFQNIYEGLNKDGKLIIVIDLPEGKDLKKFGAIKKVLGDKEDGAGMEINLFKDNSFICTLNAFYFTPKTIEKTLKLLGFINVFWHKPIISEEGIKILGNKFWKGYVDAPELGYLSAEKILRNTI